jgi:hypothetical protein
MLTPNMPIVYINEQTVWEYQRITRQGKKDAMPTEEELNELGRDGWELSGVTTVEKTVYFYFKRAKN